MVEDFRIYASIYKNEWWDKKKLNTPFLLIRWEFDYESSESYFKDVVNMLWIERCIIKTVPKSTHFWMWEKNYKIWTKMFIEWLDELEKRIIQ
jgi:hypothetical protein